MYVLSECYTKLNEHESNVFDCNLFSNKDKCVVEIINIFDLFSIYFLQVERCRIIEPIYLYNPVFVT